MKELNAMTKLALPEGYPFGGFYLVNRRMKELNAITKFALPEGYYSFRAFFRMKDEGN